MSKLVESPVCQMQWSYAQIIIPTGIADQGDINTDAIILKRELDYPFVCYYMSLNNSKLNKVGLLRLLTSACITFTIKNVKM
jgi:hypothetical protein